MQEHETVTMTFGMLLIGLLSLADPAAFLTQPKHTFSGMDTAHSGHIPIISNQENASQTRPQVNLTEAIRQLRFPPPRYV